MKPGFQLLVKCLLVCMAWTSGAYAAHGNQENGGVIILRSSLQLCPDAPLDNTLVVVATDEDLAALLRDFPGGTEDIAIALNGVFGKSEFLVRLQWLNREELIGQATLTGQPVHVVNHSYAVRRHWISSRY